MKTYSTFTINNKKYEYSIQPKKTGVTTVICKAAKINQDFLNEDVPALLTDLPHLIIAEEEYNKKQSKVVRFRVSEDEKRLIKQKAIKKGYRTVSAFLKDMALKI